MVNGKFVKIWLISSSLFFIIANLLDFLLTQQINDGLWYLFGLIMSFGLFGPIIATLVIDYKETHHNMAV